MARILVVDDSPTDADKMMHLLAKHGHQVLTAACGSDGIEVASEEQPALILMDVVMPGINGFQATRELTRAVSTKHIPVVLVSAKTQEVDRVWGQRQGASGYVTKPVVDSEMMSLVNELLVGRV